MIYICTYYRKFADPDFLKRYLWRIFGGNLPIKISCITIKKLECTFQERNN